MPGLRVIIERFQRQKLTEYRISTMTHDQCNHLQFNYLSLLNSQQILKVLHLLQCTHRHIGSGLSHPFKE